MIQGYDVPGSYAPATPGGAVAGAGVASGGAAGRASAAPVERTGEPGVDAALERLESLRTAPLSQTPAGFDEVHQLLHLTLVDDGR